MRIAWKAELVDLPIKGITPNFGIVIDVLHGIVRHCMSMSIASIFQEIELITKLVLRVFTSRITKDSAGTASDVGLSIVVNIVSGVCRLQRIRCVGRIDVDAIRAVMPTKLWVDG